MDRAGHAHGDGRRAAAESPSATPLPAVLDPSAATRDRNPRPCSRDRLPVILGPWPLARDRVRGWCICKPFVLQPAKTAAASGKAQWMRRRRSKSLDHAGDAGDLGRSHARRLPDS
jgi:hypothetical protein